MDTKRKVTLGLSYLRSAVQDILVSQPSRYASFQVMFNLIKRTFDDTLIRTGLIPKCYNIHLRKTF